MKNRPTKIFASSRLVLVLLGAAVLFGCDSPEQRAQSHYERGLELVDQGEPAKARLEFRNALKLKEGFVLALYSLGRLEQSQNRHEQAARIFFRIAEQAPEHVEARVNLARILLLAGQLDEALKFADQAYALESANTDILVLKAAIALKLGNDGDAVRFADAVLVVEPDNFDALIVRAAERLAASDPKGALAFLDKGVEKHERNVGLQLFRIKSLAALKNDAGIEKVFSQLINYYPDNAEFRYGFARWYLRTGRKDEAENVMRKFAADAPGNVKVGLQLISFLAREKGVKSALKELEARIAEGGGVFAYQIAFAQMTFGQGEYAKAVTLLNELIKETDNEADVAKAQVLLATMMVSRRELDRAEELIASVLKADATNVDALSVRASIRVGRKQYTEAIEDLSLALNEAPESSRVLQLLAQVYELSGSVELAQDHFAKVAKLERFKPAHAMNFVRFLLRYGKSNQAERVLAEIRRAAPGNKEVLALLARLRLARQDWLGAHEIADVLHKLEDRSSTADLILAESLSGQEKHAESIKLLQSSISDPNNPNSPVASLVKVYVRAGKADEAEKFLKTILSSNPDNLPAQVLLASLHELNGRIEDAEAAFKTAVARHPDNIVGFRALAEFHVRGGRLKAAQAAVMSGLERQKDNTTLRLLSALILEQLGDYEKAIAEYDALFQLEPRSTIVANNLASLLAEHRSDEDSIKKAYAIAVRFRDSNVPQFVDTLGWIHYRRGEYDQAVTLLKTAAEKLPNAGLVQYHLGIAYKELGRNELAIESLQKALELNEGKTFPQWEQAKLALEDLNSAAKF